MSTELPTSLSTHVQCLGASTAKQNGDQNMLLEIDIYFSLNKQIITTYESAANVLLL
jgi:hypothetical protein